MNSARICWRRRSSGRPRGSASATGGHPRPKDEPRAVDAGDEAAPRSPSPPRGRSCRTRMRYRDERLDQRPTDERPRFAAEQRVRGRVGADDPQPRIDDEHAERRALDEVGLVVRRSVSSPAARSARRPPPWRGRRGSEPCRADRSATRPPLARECAVRAHGRARRRMPRPHHDRLHAASIAQAWSRSRVGRWAATRVAGRSSGRNRGRRAGQRRERRRREGVAEHEEVGQARRRGGRERPVAASARRSASRPPASRAASYGRDAQRLIVVRRCAGRPRILGPRSRPALRGRGQRR